MLSTQLAPTHYAIIEATDLAATTKRQYCLAIDRMIAAHVDPRDIEALTKYAHGLKTSSPAFLKSALLLLFTDYANRLKSSATPENLAEVQAVLLNIEAMMNTIKIKKSKGTRTHVWLTAEQIEQLTALPDRATMKGKRDWIVLATLLATGARRDELSNLTSDALKSQPVKNGVRYVMEILGKGSKSRIVPVSRMYADHLKEWIALVGAGRIARSIDRVGRIGESLSGKSINEIVGEYGTMIGVPELQSHDCRRSFAMIGLNEGIPIEQISVVLGHGNISTTQKYLNLKLNLIDTISDYIPLSGD
jgi:site-specific recombinase XerD